MGTEFLKNFREDLHKDVERVKLNNPLMGTELHSIVFSIVYRN